MFPLTKWHAAWLAAIAGVTALIAVPAFRHRAPPDEPLRVTKTPAPAAAATPTAAPTRVATLPGPIYVHVSGQVARPGLYRMPPGSRVMDAITGSGGATADADLDALNLATPLRDGQKLVVPRFGEPPPEPVTGYLADSPAAPEPEPILVRADAPQIPPEPAPTAEAALADESPTAAPAARSSSSSASAKLKNPGDGVVSLNHGGKADLMRLPGVGPATAARILEYRAQHGGFQTVEELMEVKGIGEKKLAKMRPFIVIK
ncbi:MAG TPA: helix-hairpin-helix domain-containing protein [Armatimonadota bacterium]|jgi:competence protein ComEA